MSLSPRRKHPLRREPPRTDDTEAVRALRDSLWAANQSIADWQAKTAELQTQLDQLREDQKRQSAIETNLNEQLASSKRLIEAKDTELSGKNGQLAQLETANRKLSADSSAAGQKASQTLKYSDELQEIYRRREAALHTLIDRYKDVTEQYRAFASVLENRRGPEGTAGNGIATAGPELGAHSEHNLDGRRGPASTEHSQRPGDSSSEKAVRKVSGWALTR